METVTDTSYTCSSKINDLLASLECLLNTALLRELKVLKYFQSLFSQSSSRSQESSAHFGFSVPNLRHMNSISSLRARASMHKSSGR